MARPATSPAVRLVRLKDAAARAKKLKRAVRLTAVPMAEMLGVGWPVLRGWCDDIPALEANGAVVRGANGIEWQFDPRATIKTLTAYFAGEIKSRQAKARKVRQAIGGVELAGVPDDMGLDEIARMVRVARELREEAERQGRLVDVAKVREAVDRMVTVMQQAGLQAAREQDPTGRWPAEIAEKFEDAVSSIILRMGRAGEDCLRALGGGTA